ncbi:MAG: 1A family penicillin-binding protein [uncultured bacterium (gcode 4)]|uniref:peptidoglycan glycosyltransferase n=1 Tax=uncultured bacterium (gcode 4) TaxID=1234023 RepID=K2ADV5_9BACT|nr:MAG: 1A family penicillin-binding protein [uncultured bacterium (gcode 4)]
MKIKKKIIITSIILSLPVSYLFIKYLLPLNLNALPESSIIYDVNWVQIWEIPYEEKIRRKNISYDQIPEFYRKALVILEDKSFYTNNWVDLKWLVRSTIINLKSGQIVQGGSTISSQLIRNNLWLNERRSLWKKLQEFILALRLNWKYSKTEILEKYANQVYFGYLNYGLDSAANYYFWKSPENLTKAELIALLSIPKNPKLYDPYKNKQTFKTRFLIIAETLEKNNLIDKNELNSIKNEQLKLNKDHRDKLPYIRDFIAKKWIRENIIDTTIDYNLTKKIEELWDNSIFSLAWKNVWDYGILVLDRKSSELKVMIWGIDYYKQNWQVNSTLALRQPGSTIKPFNYLLAFANFGIKPTDTILDLPVNYSTDKWYSYEPKNYSTKYTGEVSLSDALAQSINIPAVKLLEKVWVWNLLNFLKKLWITSLTQDENFYGLALTLGVWEVSLYELTQAYNIFANDGKLCLTKYLKNAPLKCENIIEKKYTDDINYILSNRYFKLAGYPINSALDFADKKVFVKTGTSRNYRDNWTIGYTDNYIIWVWVGNKDASNMKWVSWATGAGEIFSKIVNFLEKDNTSDNSINLTKNTRKYLEITNPLDNEKYKIDEFVPSDAQKIKLEFSTNMAYDSYFWTLNNKKISSQFINLTNWKHILKINLEKNWEIIKENEVSFEVVN